MHYFGHGGEGLIRSTGVVLQVTDNANMFKSDWFGFRLRHGESFMPSAEDDLKDLPEEATDRTDKME